MFNQICTCKHCGSDKLITQTAYVEDVFYPYNVYRVKCCNCGAILSDEQEQEATTVSNLVQLVDQMSSYHPQIQSWITSPSAWIYELYDHPERFRRNDKDELIWLGYKVITTLPYSNDEDCFWLMADKIIPKEN